MRLWCFSASRARHLVFWWTSQRNSGAAGAVAAALLLTNPSFVAGSAMVTVDIGTATFACLAAYTIWRFLRNPSFTETLVAGTCLGLAQASKFSLLVLFPSLLLLAAAPASPALCCFEAVGRAGYLCPVSRANPTPLCASR